MINSQLSKEEKLIGELLTDMYGNYGKIKIFYFFIEKMKKF